MISRFCILCVVLTMSACTTTQTFAFRKIDGPVLRGGNEFVLSNPNDDTQSFWASNKKSRICRVSFDVTVLQVHPKDGRSAFAEVEMRNQQTEQSLSLLIYWDRNTSRVWPLIEFADDEPAEYLDIEFGLGDTYHVSVDTEPEESTLIVEPVEKMELLANPPQGTTQITIDVIPIGVGISTNRVVFTGIDINVQFQNVQIAECAGDA